MASFGIILTGGPYQTERWETACGIANAALDRRDSVTFFLFLDGVYNALATQKFPALEKLPNAYFKSLLERGATIYACEVCTNNRGLEEGRDFLLGVKVQGAVVVSSIVGGCDRVITL